MPAALLFSPWLGMIAWLLILPGATLDMLPGPARRMLTPVWLISWFVVPPPFQWDEDLAAMAPLSNIANDGSGP